MISTIRTSTARVIGVGNYVPGFQAQLDFDYLSGADHPTLLAVVTPGRRSIKLFWGTDEVMIPCYATFSDAKKAVHQADWLFNTSSSRKALVTTREFFSHYPDALGAHVFAEGINERDALSFYHEFQKEGKLIVGPAGVGMIVPGHLKLGVIGGVDHRQLQQNHLNQVGTTAVISASGGMMNEIITQVVRAGSLVSFALCVGGDRFPSTQPSAAFLLAQDDPSTEAIVYYGELGGQDEYEIVDLIKQGRLTKPIIAYIAGTIGEQFAAPIQFGHAKAMARSRSETASAKRQALAEVGVTVSQSIKEFVTSMDHLPRRQPAESTTSIGPRRARPFSSTISDEKDGEYYFVGSSLTDWAQSSTIAEVVMSGLLGHRPSSRITTEFFELVFKLSVDHGPQVSGAVNTIITARAGKDMVDGLAAGLLTIGPRFGGATNSAARTWQAAVAQSTVANTILSDFGSRGEPVPGIGHKKYRLDLPDPRVKLIDEFLTSRLSSRPHLEKARSVEAVTLTKKPNLILNVDGIIAAGMLDVLMEAEQYDSDALSSLVATDFFNGLFVIPRTVGFISHFLDQRRLDEGLFRLPDDDISML